MDLRLNALIGATYLIPIAITLRKVYAPCFDIPDAFVVAIAKLDKRYPTRSHPPEFCGTGARHRPRVSARV